MKAAIKVVGTIAFIVICIWEPVVFRIAFILPGCVLVLGLGLVSLNEAVKPSQDEYRYSYDTASKIIYRLQFFIMGIFAIALSIGMLLSVFDGVLGKVGRDLGRLLGKINDSFSIIMIIIIALVVSVVSVVNFLHRKKNE